MKKNEARTIFIKIFVYLLSAAGLAYLLRYANLVFFWIYVAAMFVSTMIIRLELFGYNKEPKSNFAKISDFVLYVTFLSLLLRVWVMN